MTRAEQPEVGGRYDIIEILARYMIGQIRMEDMSEDNQATLSYYFSLMDDDPEFRKKVISRKNEITYAVNNGRKIPLFTDEQLAKAKRHRRKKKIPVRVIQVDMFEDAAQNETTELVASIDPERKLARIHRLQAYSIRRNHPVNEDMKDKKHKLRNLIGLPVARGKDEHVNDEFYKFLIKKIVTFDNFGVFGEFDRVVTELPPELDLRINKVKGLVDELLNSGLNLRERYQRFNQFSDEYREKRG